MLELRTDHAPPRAELLRSLGTRLHQVIPGFRPIAQDLLAEDSRIDWFGADADGVGVLALVGEREDDALLLVARWLAQRTWVERRLPDWLKLAPTLPLRPEAGLRGVLLCPSFGAEARAAAASREAGRVVLVTWRSVRNGSGSDVLLDPEEGPASAPATGGAIAPASPLPGGHSGFRTGLSERDLGLSEGERSEFD